MNIKKVVSLLFFLCVTIISIAQDTTTSKYFRHLKYNHVSPYIKLTGIYPISKAKAKNTSHYIFTFNSNKEIVLITNNHYFTERRHPLASIGAYKTVITYQKTKEIRTFFNKNGNRITNDRGVFKEVFTKNKKGSYTNLEFFDLKDQPMESNWGIFEYNWFKKGHMIIEKRYNLKKKPMDISSYFKFGITGMTFTEDGSPIANYNLNETLEITNNSTGVASYQDTYDEQGNHIKYTYHDKENKLIKNSFGLSVGIKKYDSIGNYIKQEHYDPNMKLIREREITNNQYVRMSKKASQKDSLEIKRISLGYLNSLQELQPKLMNEVMNDSLNKVTIGYNRSIKKEVVTSISRERMLENAKNWNKSNTKFPPKPNDQLKILDIYHRIATVKLQSDNWVEYLHLIKLDGKWSIINILWQHKNVTRYPY